jgi:hypothetical protein
MIRKMIPVVLTFFSLTTLVSGQITCPACEIDLPAGLPDDTLYLAAAPVGRVGEWYSADIGFRVPLSTTPVSAIDSTVTPGVTINKITLTGLTNLPPGLAWEVPQAVFNLPDSTDGCIKICGMPLQPGLYMVNVVITAQVFIFSQSATFSFPILIEPAQSITEGFTILNASGCGVVTTAFANNVPSGGNSGFSYFWDFGNGNFSPQENPAAQTYTTPGQYVVNYQAVIDTFGHFLTNVRVNQVSCSDLFNGPDLKIFIYDPDSVEVFASSTIQNASPPVEFIVNIPIGPGNYRLRVIDVDDGIFGGADDECGTITFNRTLSGNLQGGPLHAFLEIIHPTDTIRSSDTVTVFPMPAPPFITGVPNGPLCDGEVLTVTVDYTDNLQWYRDSVPVIPGEEPVLDIVENGVYHVIYTSPDGCRASSPPAFVVFTPLPSIPVYVSSNNRLSLFDPSALPAAAALRWYLNGTIIPDASDVTYCISESGDYTLEVVDLINGCANSFTLPITYNPGFPNCIVSDTHEGVFQQGGVAVWPNPVRDVLELRIDIDALIEIRGQLMDAQGRSVASVLWMPAAGEQRRQIDMSAYPAGMYWLRLQAGADHAVVKIVKL